MATFIPDGRFSNESFHVFRLGPDGATRLDQTDRAVQSLLGLERLAPERIESDPTGEIVFSNGTQRHCYSFEEFLAQLQCGPEIQSFSCFLCYQKKTARSLPFLFDVSVTYDSTDEDMGFGNLRLDVEGEGNQEEIIKGLINAFAEGLPLLVSPRRAASLLKTCATPPRRAPSLQEAIPT